MSGIGSLESVLLLQPRHVYAPPYTQEEVGHVYMPTALLSMAARLIAADVPVELHDANFAPVGELPRFVAVAVIGAPYIQAARTLCAANGGGEGDRRRYIVGGQGVNGLKPAEFGHLFGASTVNGNDDRAFERLLGLDCGRLPSAESTSLVEAYRLIDERSMRRYLESEFCLFLSQGCRYSCSFCAAERSRPSGAFGGKRVVRERYRDVEAIEEDLQYLIGRALDFGIDGMTLYLSNLDLFQSPTSLETFAALVERLLRREPRFAFNFRGLSTVNSFLQVHKDYPDLIAKMVRCGLNRVGFGIDGATPTVWKATRKPQDKSTCLAALEVARECYGITPEVLMVFGHNGHDSSKSLDDSVEFVDAMYRELGAIPRPHVAKDVVPGNDGWNALDRRETVQYLLRRPEAFQMLDFTALPSWITHPEKEFRAKVAAAFKTICEMPEALTQFVLPEDPELPRYQLEANKRQNWTKYDI